jgi:AcrR family transcriptional regulator
MSEPLKTRREKEKQARYDAILDAAELVFSEKGYERTSMDDIARTASLSRGLLYVYFKDKSSIQRGIVLRAGESICRRLEQARGKATTGLAQISAIGNAYYQFYREQPDYFAALTTASTVRAEADDEQAEAMLCSRAETMGQMVAAIQLGLEDGTINRERIHDPLETALYLRGALHGVIMLCQSEHDELPESTAHSALTAESLIRHTIDMLTSSLASQAL